MEKLDWWKVIGIILTLVKASDRPSLSWRMLILVRSSSSLTIAHTASAVKGYCQAYSDMG